MGQKIIVVDTNIFLEFLRGQGRSQECLRLMRRVERGEIQAYMTGFSLHGIEVVLERVGKIAGLIKFLGWVIHTQNLSVYHTNPYEELQVAALIKTTGLDFDDALQYYVAKTLSTVLVSFDRDFDGTDIKRQEPDEI